MSGSSSIRKVVRRKCRCVSIQQFNCGSLPRVSTSCVNRRRWVPFAVVGYGSVRRTSIGLQRHRVGRASVGLPCGRSSRHPSSRRAVEAAVRSTRRRSSDHAQDHFDVLGLSLDDVYHECPLANGDFSTRKVEWLVEALSPTRQATERVRASRASTTARSLSVRVNHVPLAANALAASLVRADTNKAEL